MKKVTTTHNQLSIRNETDLHYEVVKEVRKRWPHFVLVVPAGECQDTEKKHIDMWNKGFLGGGPDIMIMNPHRFYNGMCIELQRDVLAQYERMGWKILISDDLVTTVLELVEYAKGVREICPHCKKSRRLLKTSESLGKHLAFFHRIDR